LVYEVCGGPIINLTGFQAKFLQFHEKHGPIVRYGVNSISISDPGAMNIVYSSRAGFITVGVCLMQKTLMLADSYRMLIGISNGKEVASLVSTAGEATHGALQRSITRAFTPTATLDYEICIGQKIPDLMEALERYETVDII
jgi:hypothetical protein